MGCAIRIAYRLLYQKPSIIYLPLNKMTEYLLNKFIKWKFTSNFSGNFCNDHEHSKIFLIKFQFIVCNLIKNVRSIQSKQFWYICDLHWFRIKIHMYIKERKKFQKNTFFQFFYFIHIPVVKDFSSYGSQKCNSFVKSNSCIENVTYRETFFFTIIFYCQ